MEIASTFQLHRVSIAEKFKFAGDYLYYTDDSGAISRIGPLPSLKTSRLCILPEKVINFSPLISKSGELLFCIEFMHKEGVYIINPSLSSDPPVGVTIGAFDIDPKIIGNDIIITKGIHNLYVFQLVENPREMKLKYKCSRIGIVPRYSEYVVIESRRMMIGFARDEESFFCYDLKTCKLRFQKKFVISSFSYAFSALNPDTVIIATMGEIQLWTVYDYKMVMRRSIHVSIQAGPVICSFCDEKHFMTGPHVGGKMKVDRKSVV